MRIIVDTSSILRGLLMERNSDASFLVDRIRDKTHTLVMTEEMSKELTVAVYLVAEKANKNPKSALRAVARFLHNCERADTITTFKSCKDKDDAMFIECAIDNDVSVVVSDDKSLLQLKSYCTDKAELELIKDITFVEPEAFVYANYPKRKALADAKKARKNNT